MQNRKMRERMLRILIDKRDFQDIVFKPDHPLSWLSGVSEKDAYDCLQLLKNENLVSYGPSDREETDGFYYIKVMPNGLSYFETKSRLFWNDVKHWTMNWAMVAFSAFLGWLFSMLTLLLTGRLTLIIK